MYLRTGVPPKKSEIDLIWHFAVSIFSVGGIVGGLCTACVAEKFGRKGGLLLNISSALVAAIILCCCKAARSYEMLIIGRFIIGIHVGLGSSLSIMFLVEIAPDNIRGAVASVYQLFLTVSILIAQGIGMALVYTKDKHLWPFLFGITLIPPLIQVKIANFPVESNVCCRFLCYPFAQNLRNIF